MPIYEYVCGKCRRRTSLLLRSINDTAELKCEHCGSNQLRRIMSRFAAVKSEESRLESMADPGKWGGLDENDPASVAKFIKKMGSELGEDIGREELDQMAEEAAKEAESGFAGESEYPGAGSGESALDE